MLLGTFLLGFPIGVLSQTPEIDSLKNIVQTGQQDSNMVAALNALSSEVLNNEDIAGARKYALEAEGLAKDLNDVNGKALAQKNVGMAYYYEGDYLKVLDYWSQSLESFERAKDSLGIANLTRNLGAIYYDQGSNTKAIEYYLRSLRIAEKIHDTLGIATALVNIGGVYSDNPNDYEKALYYYNGTKQYLKPLDNVRITTAYLSGVGEIYKNREEYDKALEFFEEALPLNVNTNTYAHLLTQMGDLQFKRGDKARALEYLDQAYKTAKENRQQYEIVSALIAEGNIFKKQDFDRALKVYAEAESIAKELDLDYQLRDIFKGLSETYAANNDFGNAFKYQGLYLAQKDTLFNLETNDKIRGAQFAFDLEKKQNENIQLEKEMEISELLAKRQKYALYGTITSLVLVFVLALGSYKRYRYVKKTNKIIEEEKNRSENLLLNILPDETALELKQFGKVKAKKFESVTVMFTDFKGFTSYSQNLSPEKLVKTVDYYFSKFDAIMDKYDLEKIKTIGDAYMCAGGLPFPTDDHPQKMVQAAFEVAQVMEEAKKETDPDIVPFEVRIGINTGAIVAGVVGTRKFAYDIWGDTVNVAARMESLSEPGKVNISESTYLLIKDTYNCEHRGQIHVKNKGMMDMYFVHGLKDGMAPKKSKKSEATI
ncbi:MAG: tetratricopeptide repeat protein [Flavobacteriales bacterium]|nr:MAG: tetratricopeptide repeat protein [Flavobacteriales bacterium]